MNFNSLVTATGTVQFAEWLPEGQSLGTVVLVHGGGVGPDGWLKTIDGQPGWAPQLAAAGYRSVVTTWPGLSAAGRWEPAANPSGEDVASGLVELISAVGAPVVLVVHSMSAAFGYRIAFQHRDLVCALVALAPAPPGDIQPEPEVLEQNSDRVVVQGSPLVWELPLTGWWEPGAEFVETKLVGASERFPREHLNDLRAQTVAIPARLLIERQNVGGAQIHIGDRSLHSLPVLQLVGTKDTDHPIETDRNTAVWMANHGGEVEFVVLDGDELGGNGHMLMQETNSAAVLAVVEQWLNAHVG